MDPDSRCKAVPVRGAVDARGGDPTCEALSMQRGAARGDSRAMAHRLAGAVALPVTGVYDGRGRASVICGGRVGSFP